MANTISIIIQAQDNASKKIREFGSEVEQAGDKAETSAKKISFLKEHGAALASVAVTAGIATRGLLNTMSESVTAANRLDSALLGLESVSNAYRISADKSKRAAQELANDGLMTVAESATGLKNLLASGFSLDQAITLMNRFKDSAAFGRQASLGFGQAIASATEGIKNGNSILVDNAGVTKNLSVMLKEAGISQDKLGQAAGDASVREAIFNGILRETNAQMGDAAKLAETAAGKQAQWDAQTQILQQRIGLALQPALLKLLEVATPLIENIAGWIERNPELSAGILITVTAVGGLITVASALGLAVMGLGPVFAMFQAVATASIAGAQGSFIVLKSLIATPLVMPAIGVAAAIGAIVAVQEAAKSAQSAVDNLARTRDDINKSDARSMEIVKENYRTGKISKDTYLKQMRILGNASGTNSWKGGMTWVGEHGPEPVYLPQGAQVTPNYRANQQPTTGGATTVVIENYNSYNERDDERFFRDLAYKLGTA